MARCRVCAMMASGFFETNVGMSETGAAEAELEEELVDDAECEPAADKDDDADAEEDEYDTLADCVSEASECLASAAGAM